MYLTQKVRYVKSYEVVYFVYISSIFLCKVTNGVNVQKQIEVETKKVTILTAHLWDYLSTTDVLRILNLIPTA